MPLEGFGHTGVVVSWHLCPWFRKLLAEVVVAGYLGHAVLHSAYSRCLAGTFRTALNTLCTSGMLPVLGLRAPVSAQLVTAICVTWLQKSDSSCPGTRSFRPQLHPNRTTGCMFEEGAEQKEFDMAQNRTIIGIVPYIEGCQCKARASTLNTQSGDRPYVAVLGRTRSILLLLKQLLNDE